MAITSEYKGFIFIKGNELSAKKLEKVRCKKKISFNSQIQTYDYVKDKLIEKAKLLGGNAIIYFEMHQTDFFCIGSGIAAILSDDKIEEIFDRFE